MMKKSEDGFKTVQDIAEELGISRRTIQYYDNIGLLPATRRSSKGYRLYDEAAVDVLRRILKLRDMGFELKDIADIINSPTYDMEAALIRLREAAFLELEGIRKRIELIDEEINCLR